jgi:FAD:protein FMN transferase
MFSVLIRICLALALLNLITATEALSQTLIKASGTTMGSIPWNVTVSQPPASQSDESITLLAQQRLDLVNKLMSTYQPDSDVSRFNKYEQADWFPVDAETARVVQRALVVCEKSNGAFDITVGPLVNLWNFGPDKQKQIEPPPAERIESVKKTVGYKNLAVQLDPPALRKSNPEIQIDLSAIAKGFAVDLIADELNKAGMVNYMVEVGGEVRTNGHREVDGVPRKWRIGITQPDAGLTDVARLALLDDASLASSGDYRNFFFYNQKRFSHIIDPRTGWPADANVASASVVANDCMTADALATTLMVIGFEDGKSLCEEFGAECYLIVRDDSGFKSFSTDDFPFQKEASAKTSTLSVVLISVCVFAAFILAMSVGVIFSNRRITGSCGGLAAMEGESACSACSNPSSECSELKDLAEKARKKEKVEQA